MLTVLTLCLLTAGCSKNADKVYFLPDAKRVILVKKGEAVTAPWDGVLVSQGYFYELVLE
jgi:hypothetical protein